MASTTRGAQRTTGPRDDPAGTLLHDDSALARIPEPDKRGWVPILFIRLGMISALTQFLVAAVVGYSNAREAHCAGDARGQRGGNTRRQDGERGLAARSHN